MAKVQLFEDFAYSTAERNRMVGSPGLESSLQYVLDSLTALDHYDITIQNFSIPTSSSSLSIDVTAYASSPFTFSPAGVVAAPLVAVANLGCNSVGYLSSATFPMSSAAKGLTFLAVRLSTRGRRWYRAGRPWHMHVRAERCSRRCGWSCWAGHV